MKLASFILAGSFLLLIFTASQYPRELNAKVLEKQMVLVENGLSINKYECSNKWYNLFLTDLKANNRWDEFNKYKFDSSSWVTTFPDAYVQPMADIYHRHQAYANYPAVNMSYQGAVDFCKWLTVWYNKQSKAKMKNVVFDLPTEQEWIAAARTGEDTLYPWQGQYMRNSKGLYQANYKVDSGDFMADGALFQREMHSYYPNKRGIYNLAGNVAEMTKEQGNHKGGSWENYADKLQINADDPYKGIAKPHPCIGFRFVARGGK